MRVDGRLISVTLDDSGALTSISRPGSVAEYRPAAGWSHCRLNGFPARAEALSGNRGFRLVAEGHGDPATQGAPSRQPPADGDPLAASGELLIEGGDELSLRFEPAAEADGAEAAESVELSLGFPTDGELHLAEFYNVGRKLDRSMPVGESYEGKLAYGFVVVRAGDLWLRFRADRHSMNGLTVRVLRLPALFAVTLRWQSGDPLRIAAFDSLAEATAEFAARLQDQFGIRRLADDPATPEWALNTRLIFCLDMMRSNLEITHDFTDVARLCDALHEAGCPKDTILYLPGWQGAYDAAHPTYRPAEALGGEAAFAAMIEAAHRHGYRVMIHATGWGIDPYHREIDALSELSSKDQSDDFQGWQFGYNRRPPRQELGYVTNWSPLTIPAGSSGTTAVLNSPATCEALLSVAGIAGSDARLQIRCGPRSVLTPPGWFAEHDRFHFPFPLLLADGRNEIEVNLVTGQSDALKPAEAPEAMHVAWRIRYSFIPESPYDPWTWPILRADTSNPAYQKRFVDELAGVVKEFGIDAVHVDATTLGWPPGVDVMFDNLASALPGIPINTELYSEFRGLGYWTFSQNATQSLIAKRKRPEEQQSLPVTDGLREQFAWLDQPSPICDFARAYIRTYPHLCAINAFVPVAKICNTFPARKLPFESAEQWRVIRDAKRLGYIPSLRVNFREHGLDAETIAAIGELSGE